MSYFSLKGSQNLIIACIDYFHTLKVRYYDVHAYNFSTFTFILKIAYGAYISLFEKIIVALMYLASLPHYAASF